MSLVTLLLRKGLKEILLSSRMKKFTIGKFQEYISEINFRVLAKYTSAQYQ